MARMGLSKKVSTVPKKETKTKAKPSARNIFLNQAYTTKPTCFLCNIKQDPISFAWSSAVVYALERLLREGLSPSMDNLEELIKTEIILVNSTLILTSFTGAIGLCERCFEDEAGRLTLEKNLALVYGGFQERGPFTPLPVHRLKHLTKRLIPKRGWFYHKNSVLASDQVGYRTLEDWIGASHFLTSGQQQRAVNRQIFEKPVCEYHSKTKMVMELTNPSHHRMIITGAYLNKNELSLERIHLHKMWKSGLNGIAKLVGKEEAIREQSKRYTTFLTNGFGARNAHRSVNSLIRRVHDQDRNTHARAETSAELRSQIRTIDDLFGRGIKDRDSNLSVNVSAEKAEDVGKDGSEKRYRLKRGHEELATEASLAKIGKRLANLETCTHEMFKVLLELKTDSIQRKTDTETRTLVKTDMDIEREDITKPTTVPESDALQDAMKGINLENPVEINLPEETPLNEMVELHLPENSTLTGGLPELELDSDSFDNLDEYLLSA